MAETTRARPPAPLELVAWSEVPVVPTVGSSPGRLLRHRRVPDALVQLAREPVDAGQDVDSYVDRQVADLGLPAWLVDRRVVRGDGRHLRLAISPGGRPVTTDLLVRIRDGGADLCVVTRASARDPELLEDVAEVVDAWTAT